MSASTFLIDWCIRYLENKDMIKGEIVAVGAKKEDSFEIEYKSGKKEFLLVYSLDPESLARIESVKPAGLFIVNNKKNVSMLIKEWSKFSKLQGMTCHFVNPLSNADKAWIINPYVHNQICDPESLDKGILAMSDMVDPTTKEELEQNLSE